MFCNTYICGVSHCLQSCSKENQQQETGKTERQTTEFEFTKEMHNFTEIKNEQLRIKY